MFILSVSVFIFLRNKSFDFIIILVVNLIVMNIVIVNLKIVLILFFLSCKPLIF